MSVNYTDFDKIWASTSPLTPYEFSESQYKEGWNFVGATPPSRQMWDFLQKNNDEKMQYLANNYLPLSGGTMTGAIKGNPVTLTADDGNGNTKSFVANADGTLIWNDKNILTDATVGTLLEISTSADISLSASAAKNITSLTIPKGTWIITGHARFDNVTSGKAYGAMFGGTSASYNSNNDSAIYVHSSSTTPISIQTTRIIVQNFQATVYFVGYANAACNVLSGATFRAIRIL